MPRQAAQRMWIVPALLSVVVLAPAAVRAEGNRIRVSTELNYITTNADTEDKRTGEDTETDRSYFLQQYNVEIEKEFFPYLFLRTGGLLRLIAADTTRVSETEGEVQAESDERLGRAFAELTLDTPLYTASGAYYWTQLKETNLDTERLFREEFDGRFDWRPEGLPTFDLEFNRFLLYDDAETRDRRDDRLRLETRYDYKGLSSDYSYTRLDSEQRILDSGSLNQIHDGGMHYADSFFNKRLSMSGGFRLRYSSLEPSGTGDFDVPVTTPAIPFSVPDDSTDPTFTDELDFDSLDAGRIGITSPPGRAVSFGLNFDFPTEFNTIYIVPSSDSRFISPLVWDVYTSDDLDDSDGVVWTLQEAGISAAYLVGEDRFEIRLSTPVDARRVKVLTTSKFDELVPPEGIGVDQISAFLTIPGTPGLEITDFVQNYNLGLRWAITDRTTTSYDGFYRRQVDTPFDRKRSTLTNSIRLQHVFNPVFVGSARVLRTDGSSSERGDSVNHLYSASLRANYFDTLNQQLVYSGRHDKEELGSGSSDSIILRTNADLYRDWSMNLDVGYTWRRPIEGANGTIALLRIGTDVAPHERLRFTIDYLASWKTEQGDSTNLDQNASFQAFWVPFRTVSLFGRVDLRRRESTGEGLLVSQDYSFNWAPFPDGALNFSFAYNQTLDTRDIKSRIISPQVEWQITRNALLTVRFNIGTIESETEVSDVRNLRAELKIFY